MTQYQVPQFIDIEDRIVGPLTLKQFLYLAFAGAILFVSWFLFKTYLWVIIAVPIIIMSLVFAFLKINDRPFMYFFISIINYYLKPKLYIFSIKPREEKKEIESKPTSQPKPFSTKTSAYVEASADKPEGEEKITRSKLKELALNLDTKR